MIKYNPDWNAHNHVDDDCNDPRDLPDDFDFESFTEDQIRYLGDYFEDYRKKYISDFVKWLLRPLDDVDDNSTDAMARNKIKQSLYRLMIVHRLLNFPDMPLGDYVRRYKLSNHVFYQIRNGIADELSEDHKNIKRVICRYKTR